MPLIRRFPPEKKVEVHALSCPKCGWKDSFVLDPDGGTVILSAETNGEGTRQPAAKRQKTCPQCGARLEKTVFSVPFSRRKID